jgi:hypothetical protein
VTLSSSLVQGSVAIFVSSLNISTFFNKVFHYTQFTITCSPLQGSVAIIGSSLNISAFYFLAANSGKLDAVKYLV